MINELIRVEERLFHLCLDILQLDPYYVKCLKELIAELSNLGSLFLKILSILKKEVVLCVKSKKIFMNSN